MPMWERLSTIWCGAGWASIPKPSPRTGVSSGYCVVLLNEAVRQTALRESPMGWNAQTNEYDYMITSQAWKVNENVHLVL